VEVHLQRRKKEQLATLAVQFGVTREELAKQPIRRYLDNRKVVVTESASDDRGGLGTELAALFSGHGLDAPLESPFGPPKKAAGLRSADSRGRLSPHKPSRSRRKKRA
jgi:hypothetical protein